MTYIQHFIHPVNGRINGILTRNNPYIKRQEAMKSNLDKIDHVVVLMLENRSFDHMLGWLGSSDKGGQKVNGVAGRKLTNPIPSYADLPKNKKRYVPVGKETNMINPNPDPGEEYAHVNTQLYGHITPEENYLPPFNTKPYNLPENKSLPKTAPMNGFVEDYINNFAAIRGRMPKYDEYSIIMNCLEEETVPVLSTLAREYAVCDAWFAPVPSQTLCNRSFMHAATSHGYVLNSPFYHWMMHETQTIFDQISDKKDPDLTWKIYYDRLDIVSLTGLQNPKVWKNYPSNFQYMDVFKTDAQLGQLPCYSFIEPRFLIDHNDQHPPVGMQILETSSVLAGEQLIYDVYDTLRKSPKWNQTLLIITYDEHGGCYDHVSPPPAVPPDPRKLKGQMAFRFDRLGVRVPAVLISPYIKQGTIVSDVHDHTSILKMIEERWGLDPLTERDKHANDLSGVLSLESPRIDSPDITLRKYVISKKSREAPLNDLQKGIIMIIAGFEDALQIQSDHNIFKKAEDLLQVVIDERRIAHIKTVGQAIDFTMDFDRRTSKRVPVWRWLFRRIKRIFE